MITSPLAYSRYFYKDEEVIISVCNYCYVMVVESRDERQLELGESQHECPESSRAFAA